MVWIRVESTLYTYVLHSYSTFQNLTGVAFGGVYQPLAKWTESRGLILLLLVPFSYKLMHHLKPFAIVVLNGEITVYSVDSPNGFEW